MMWLVPLLLATIDSASFALPVAPAETLHVTVTGSGEPVVLIPGLFGSAFGFRRLIPLLSAAGCRTIVIEPLGIGASGRPERADYSLTAQADRIAAALDTLGVAHAIIVAHSVGASMAYRLAYRRPDLVRAIVSLEGGPAEAAATPSFRRAMRFVRRDPAHSRQDQEQSRSLVGRHELGHGLRGRRLHGGRRRGPGRHTQSAAAHGGRAGAGTPHPPPRRDPLPSPPPRRHGTAPGRCATGRRRRAACRPTVADDRQRPRQRPLHPGGAPERGPGCCRCYRTACSPARIHWRFRTRAQPMKTPRAGPRAVSDPAGPAPRGDRRDSPSHP
jgi:pimeloyl-ACP methyl ester carboxylesterase